MRDYIARCLLRRGQQELVLQGMIHFAPKVLFRALQDEMDMAMANNFVILREEIMGWPNTADEFSGNQFCIAQFILDLTAVTRVYARTRSLRHQGNRILYPIGSIVADISFSELVAELERTGFMVPEETHELMTDQGYIDLHRAIALGLDPVAEHAAPAERAFRLGIPSLIARYSSAHKSLRNLRAATIMEDVAVSNPFLFVHYGQGHLEEITQLLEERGWRLHGKPFLRYTGFFLGHLAKL